MNTRSRYQHTKSSTHRAPVLKNVPQQKEYASELKKWLQAKIIAEEHKTAIREEQKKQDLMALKKRFEAPLKLGTGGIRTIVEWGSSFLNQYTIRRVALGIIKQVDKAPPHSSQPHRLVIGWDTRLHSYSLAVEMARVFLAHQCEVYLFKKACTTPELCWSVIHLSANAGIMLTASHNPPQDHGVKVYNSVGSQITHPHDYELNMLIGEVNDYDDIPFYSDRLEKHNLFFPHDRPLKSFSKLIPQRSKSALRLKILYSAAGGAGSALMQEVMTQKGTHHLQIYEPHEPVNGLIHLEKPNPEDPRAFDEILKDAKEKKYPYVLMNDPDGDRIYLAVQTSFLPHSLQNLGYFNHPDYWILSGHELSLLLFNYTLKKDKPKYILKTFVTNPLIDVIAKQHHIPCINVLTGFKWIGHRITDLALSNQLSLEDPIFCCEESGGFLFTPRLRDKEGFLSVSYIVDWLADCERQNIHPFEQYLNILKQYGLYLNSTCAASLPNRDPDVAKKLKEMKAYPPRQINQMKIERVDLYEQPREDGLGEVAMISWTLQDQSLIFLRPSGTENKFKSYLTVKCHTSSSSFLSDFKEAQYKLEQLKKEILDYISKE